MRSRSLTLLVAAFVALFVQCSFSSLDDLKETPDGSGKKCTQHVDCTGCSGCDAICACLTPPDLTNCVASCKADGGGSEAQAGGSGGTVAGGTGGLGGAPTGGSGGVVNFDAADDTPDVDDVDSDADSSPCAQCGLANCQSETAACYSNTACIALLNCVQQCVDQSCADACFQQFPDTNGFFNSLMDCLQLYCATVCS